jgi:alpha-beta hydrolase superfamily lysophospholipase
MVQPVDRTYTAADATALPMRVWLPQRPRAVLVYLHGIQSHSGWYEASSRHLAEAGVAVYQLERRGSGTDRSHERGHVDRAETWLDDVAAAARLACGETGFAAAHLAGVSWGGKLALACAAHRLELYRSLLLAAPGIVPRVDPTLAVKVRVAQSLLAGNPLRRFPIPLHDPNLFTENPERVRYIAHDPLSLHEVTARFMYESRRLDGLVRSAARVASRPTFLAIAEKDRIIDNAATMALVEAMPCSRRQVIVYPNAGHTLEFEPDPVAYFRDLAAWIMEIESV